MRMQRVKRVVAALKCGGAAEDTSVLLARRQQGEKSVAGPAVILVSSGLYTDTFTSPTSLIWGWVSNTGLIVDRPHPKAFRLTNCINKCVVYCGYVTQWKLCDHSICVHWSLISLFVSADFIFLNTSYYPTFPGNISRHLSTLCGCSLLEQ